MWLILIEILFITRAVAQIRSIPTFVIDTEQVINDFTPDTNPYRKLSPSKFTDIIHTAIKNSELIVIFLEETFSVEDVTTKTVSGTPFYHLNSWYKTGKAKYLPAVVEPYQTLNTIFQPRKSNTFNLATSGDLSLLKQEFKYYYIVFRRNENETRAESLHKHDLIIREVYTTFAKLAQAPIVAIYTGKVNPVKVTKSTLNVNPLYEATRTQDESTIVTEHGLFRLGGVYVSRRSLRSSSVDAPQISEQTANKDGMSTTISYEDFELQFNFTFFKDRWEIETVSLLEGGEEVGMVKMRVGAPWNWSYLCREPLVILNTRDGSTVTISQYKIEPLLPNMKSRRQDDAEEPPEPGPEEPPEQQPDQQPEQPPPSPPPEGGNTVDCGPYFNSNILAGLMVSSILVVVLGVAVFALLSVSANDRYDDPLAKSVNVNADVN